MNQTKLTQPILIKFCKILVGILAFTSIVSAQNLFNEPIVIQLVIIFRLVSANVAFIAIMSNTKIGRIVSIAFFSLLAISGLSGIVVSVVEVKNAPISSGVIMVLSTFILWISLSYVFGQTSKQYYREILKKM